MERRQSSSCWRKLKYQYLEGDQWKIGGGTTWGWYSYDPKLNLVYYGSGNPSTWNPVQRPGDNKWSMSLWARDADTGEVKWVYQMTPHDEWDFDGINETPLVDQEIGGKMRPTIVHLTVTVLVTLWTA
jgi:lanthanide-dependent methanol dehydrogenase